MSILLIKDLTIGDRKKTISHIIELRVGARSERFFFYLLFVDQSGKFVRRKIDNVLFPPSPLADHIFDNIYDAENRVNVQILEERLVQSSCWIKDHLYNTF